MTHLSGSTIAGDISTLPRNGPKFPKHSRQNLYTSEVLIPFRALTKQRHPHSTLWTSRISKCSHTVLHPKKIPKINHENQINEAAGGSQEQWCKLLLYHPVGPHCRAHRYCFFFRRLHFHSRCSFTFKYATISSQS